MSDEREYKALLTRSIAQDSKLELGRSSQTILVTLLFEAISMKAFVLIQDQKS